MSDQNVAPDAPPVEPAAPVVEPAAPAAPAPTSTAPWAADLQAAFQDDAERARVDQFMREKYQPYVTKLEQESAPARSIYEGLQGDNSLETYLGLAEQLYGEETAALLAEAIINKYGEETDAPAEPAAPAAPAEPAQPAGLTAEEAEEWRAERAQRQYWAEMDRVKAAFTDEQGNTLVNQDLFHPFVMGAGGDFDQGLEAYKVWHAQAYPAAPAEEAPAPPATLGSDHVGGPTPPVAERYTSMDKALDDTLAEMRANRNPPPASVGSA